MEVFDYEKLYSDPSIDKHIDAASKKYNSQMEKVIGVGLNMPFENTNSAARKNMFSSQYQQKVCLVNPEVPILSTGYENIFGQHSSCYCKMKGNWNVIARIEKFSNNPGHHYYLIIMDDNNNLDVIERVSYCHNTETYGFMYNNDYLDSLKVGSVIKDNTTYKKSNSFDNYDNYMSGKNLRAAYISDANTTEDAIEISEFTAKALARTEIKIVTILINDNDIPLNLYGDNNVYKFMPDIGEDIKNGILCGTRTERNDESFFTQSVERLKTPIINDVTFKAKGKVIDINVYCNKDIANSNNGIYEGQLIYYVNDHKRFCKEIVDLLKNYIDNTDYVKSYELSKLYSQCQDVVQGKQYFKDNVFSNIIVEVVIYNEAPLEEGDKITSRYGGKGVISKVIPDDMMPRIHGTDDRIDLIWNQATCVNRLNPGQLFELSLNFIATNLVNTMRTGIFDVEQCVDLMSDFFGRLSPEYAKEFYDSIESCINDDEVIFTMNDLFVDNDDGLYIVLEPISESITFEKLMELYNEYKWITPVFIDVPITDSRGNVRYVQSKKPSIVAMQYIYRMKQNAEEKFSSTSLSATNIRNLNSKSKASKMYIRVHPNTPIRFGEMENSIFNNAMGAEIQVQVQMIYSTSPQARRDCKELLNSYKLNVELDEDSKSRSAEILNAIIKVMGIKFSFKKKLIKYGKVDNQIDDSKLFRFYDAEKDKLFKQIGKDENELFVSIGENENKLFIPIEAAERKLFEFRGE